MTSHPSDQPVSALRTRMIEDMTVRGFNGNTRSNYIRNVRAFAAFIGPRRGRSKPETFKFLGFVLICDKTRRNDFRIRRKSRRDRMCAKLREVKEALRHRMHRPTPETGKWLAQIVTGYFAYHALPTNSRR